MKRLLLAATLLMAISGNVVARDEAPPAAQRELTVNVLGMVNKPGRVWFPAERGLSLVAAISLAGGQSRQGDLKRVKLTRKNAKGEEATTVIDVDAVLKGRASDLRLEPGDTVFVSDRADCDV